MYSLLYRKCFTFLIIFIKILVKKKQKETNEANLISKFFKIYPDKIYPDKNLE